MPRLIDKNTGEVRQALPAEVQVQLPKSAVDDLTWGFRTLYATGEGAKIANSMAKNLGINVFAGQMETQAPMAAAASTTATRPIHTTNFEQVARMRGADTLGPSGMDALMQMIPRNFRVRQAPAVRSGKDLIEGEYVWGAKDAWADNIKALTHELEHTAQWDEKGIEGFVQAAWEKLSSPGRYEDPSTIEGAARAAEYTRMGEIRQAQADKRPTLLDMLLWNNSKQR